MLCRLLDDKQWEDEEDRNQPDMLQAAESDYEKRWNVIHRVDDIRRFFARWKPASADDNAPHAGKNFFIIPAHRADLLRKNHSMSAIVSLAPIQKARRPAQAMAYFP
jgi:hypothetical protein